MARSGGIGGLVVRSVRVRLLAIVAILVQFALTAAAADLFDGASVLGLGTIPPLRTAQAQLLVPQPDGTYYSPSGTCPPNCNTTTVAPVMQPTTVVQQYDPYVLQTHAGRTAWPACKCGVFGEFIYWQPRGVDVAYAVPQNGLLVAGATPIGPASVVDPGYSPGFRAGLFLAMGPEARLIGTYTWFRSTADASVGTTAPNVINPLVLFPGTFNAGSDSQTASASLGTDLQLIDIDYQVAAENCPLYWWGYSLGARYGRLNQNFSADFPFAPPDGSTSFNTSVVFEGVGPRAGFEGERVIFANRGFRAYGKTSASFPVGQWRSTYVQTNQFGGTQVNTGLTVDRIVPILDFEIGLAWVGPGEWIRISGGYMVAAWFNSVTTDSWINSVNNLSYSPGSSTVTFDGLTARAEVHF